MAADAWSYFIAHPEAVFKETWCLGPYAGVDYNSPYLIVNSIVSYSSSLQREKGGVGKISPIGLSTLYLTANFQNRVFYVNTNTEKEEGRGDCCMSLNIHFMEHWHWANPCLS